MKINIIQGAFFPVPPRLGGAVEKVWYGMGRQFAREGHEVTHISRTFADLPQDETANGVRYLRFKGYPATNNTLLLKWKDLLYSRRALRQAPPADILVTHTFWTPILYGKGSVKGQCYVHAARFPKGQMKFYRHAARLQTVSSPVASAIREELSKDWVDSKLSVIPNPVLIPGKVRDFRNHPVEDKIKLLYTGRVHPEKGLHLLVESLKKLPPSEQKRFSLKIVGPIHSEEGGGGERYRKSLLNLVRNLPTEVSILEPVYDTAKLDDIYRQADLFVYPSLADQGETFGLAVLEAMANGLPVVVSAIPCFRDFVVPGVNGEIFNHQVPHAAAELAHCLQSFYLKRAEFIQWGAAARKTAEGYSEEKVAQLYLQDFESLLGKHAGS